MDQEGADISCDGSSQKRLCVLAGIRHLDMISSFWWKPVFETNPGKVESVIVTAVFSNDFSNSEMNFVNYVNQ